MKKIIQKIYLLMAITLTPILVIAASLSTIASAEQPQIVKEKAIGTEGIIKVKSLDVLEKHSQNKDIEISAEKGTDKVIFKAINKAIKDSDFKVDLWKISVDGAIVDINLPISSIDNGKLKAKESKQVAEFSIKEYFDELEEYPGIYEITLLGFDREYSLAKIQEYSENEEEYTLRDLAVYKIVSKMVIGYDQDKIKANGHVLKSKNVQLATDGTNPFAVASGETRNAVLYLVNNESHPVSSLVYHSSANFMSAELTKSTGYETISDFPPDQCRVLMPGESLEFMEFDIGKDVFPLGGDKSIAEKMGDSKSARPGTYVVEIQGVTQACSIDGEEIPGMAFESLVAFEVN